MTQQDAPRSRLSSSLFPALFASRRFAPLARVRSRFKRIDARRARDVPHRDAARGIDAAKPADRATARRSR